MAYTPKQWVCGETITADGLNNIEEGIQEALECCDGGLPEVTAADNGDLLTVVDGEWAKAEPGFKCTETATTLTEESVTTSGSAPIMGNFSYSTLIDADVLKVTFSGTAYEVSKITQSGNNFYGGFGANGPDFSEYPFTLMSNGSGNTLFTETAGTYSVKIETISETIETSECFEKAVKEIVPSDYECSEERTTQFDGDLTTTAVSGQSYSECYVSPMIYADLIAVTFNGTEYKLNKEGYGYYGDLGNSGPDFSRYPFFIISDDGDGRTLFDTPSAGTYTVKIESVAENIVASECIKKVIKKYGLQNIEDATGFGAVVANNLTYNRATGQYSFAEGCGTSIASGYGAHAEGSSTASGARSHSEGDATSAVGDHSHAEGQQTHANGERSHAEGFEAYANGRSSHAEGENTTASGTVSHAEGSKATASGSYSHAQNEGTIAQSRAQTVIGRYNTAQGANGSIVTTDYAFIIGNGTGESNRSNAFAIKWDGTFVFADGTEITPAKFAALLALLP